MSFSINTNVESLQAQNYLQQSSAFQNKTISEVTSGLRITQSGDDAAGLAIANGYRANEAVLTQGLQNATDGQSQLQIMDGGMSNISQLLDRASTLASESATGTFTGSRDDLNAEFQSVLGEIDRQAQAIGLNTGGQFAKNLSVFIGGGTASGNINAISDGSVSVNLSQSTVDSASLGLQGVQAIGTAGTDIGTGSGSTSVSSILANATNQASDISPNTTTFYLKGPGFSGQGVAISVNTKNIGDTSDLVGAINSAIQAAGNNGTQQGTALANAGITASVNTDSAGTSAVDLQLQRRGVPGPGRGPDGECVIGQFPGGERGGDGHRYAVHLEYHRRRHDRLPIRRQRPDHQRHYRPNGRRHDEDGHRKRVERQQQFPRGRDGFSQWQSSRNHIQ